MSRIYEALKRAEQNKGALPAGLSQPACLMPVADPTTSFIPAIPLATTSHNLGSRIAGRYDEVPRVEWVRRDGVVRPAFVLEGRSQ